VVIITRLLLNQYGRLFLWNTPIFFCYQFNSNPSLSQQSVLHRFAQCTLNTILPNPKSYPLNIGKYFVFAENYTVHLGHGKTFVVKKLGSGAKRIESYFFPDKLFCIVLCRVYFYI
jgi:hypothetical protein